MTSREPDPNTERTVIPVVEETVDVKKRATTTGKVRVARTSRQRKIHVDEPLDYEEVDVKRVAINQTVAAPPEVRQEGDTTIIPVLEEQVVVEKRLVLREELHITKRHKQNRFVADVPAQFDDVIVERDKPDAGDSITP